MKKYLLIFSSFLLPSMAMALISNPPADILFKKNVYAYKLSPNGEWIGSMAGDASVYNIETGEYFDYWGSFLGLGNCVANNGIAVGDATDSGVILINGRIIHPESLSSFSFCDLHGITPDATRVVGIVNNPNRDGVSYVPIVCEMDADGTLGEAVILPYPKKDFFDMTPQWSTGVWISDDGKTVIGEVVDWRGMYTAPIVYTEDENGTWSYFMPSEPLFNPEHIVVPTNPWSDEPPAPEFVDFMSPLARTAYEQAYDDWIMSGYNPMLYPEPENYMTPEQIEAYNEAAARYNEWADNPDLDARIKEFNSKYFQVLATSPSFSQNDFTLHPSGEFMMTKGGFEDGDSFIYKFNIPGGDYEVINLPQYYSPYPSQILPDGTLIAATGMQETPTCFILTPGSKDLITFYDYIRPEYPEAVEWMELNFIGGTGLISMSADQSVIVSGLTPGNISDYDFDTSDYYYSSYIFKPGSDIGGVESIVASQNDGVYRVYNLQGVKMLETKDPAEINTLPKGIYIVNGKKIAL